jgi:hypothetical protein
VPSKKDEMISSAQTETQAVTSSNLLKNLILSEDDSESAKIIFERHEV